MSEGERELPDETLCAEVERLILRRHGGELGSEELARLEWLLMNEPAARRLYVQYVNDTLSMRELLEDGAAVEEPTISAGTDGSPGRPHTTWRRWMATGALAASLLFAAAFFGHWLLLSKPEAAGPVATLSRSVGAQWSGDAAAPGEALHPGRSLHLTSGLAEIKFHDGARVVLEGPATLTVESAAAGRLDAGKLVARVPPRAQGFTIHTPAETIVDRGTEFGVFVRAEGRGQRAEVGTEVHVFTGRVDVMPAANAEASATPSQPSMSALSAGQALRFSAAGQPPAPFAAQPGQFMRQMPPLLADDFESYAKDSDIHGHAGWRLHYGIGAWQRARVVEPGASSPQIFGRRVVELRDSYGSAKHASPLLKATYAPENVPEDLRIQFDFRRLDADTVPRFTLHNASWNLVLGPEVRLLDRSDPPLAKIEPQQWYRMTLHVPSGSQGGKLRVRLERLVKDKFIDPVTAQYDVGPSVANDTLDFTYHAPQTPKAGAWQIDNVHVELDAYELVP